MADEKQDVVIDKAAVAAAMMAIEEAGEYPSVPKIRTKLKEMFGRSGNNNRVHDLQRQVFADRAAAAAQSNPLPPAAIDPLPEEYAAPLRDANDAVARLMGVVGDRLAQGLATLKAELYRSAAAQIAEAKAQSQRLVDNAFVEAKEALADADRLERELEEEEERVVALTAELITTREKLAATSEQASQAGADRDATKAELSASRERVDAAARERGELLADKAKLTEQLRVAQERADRLAQENEQLAANNAVLTAALDSARVDLSAEKARSEQLASDRDDAKREAAREREKAEQATAAASEAKTQVARLEAEQTAARRNLRPADRRGGAEKPVPS